jgi:hypothetical protein
VRNFLNTLEPTESAKTLMQQFLGVFAYSRRAMMLVWQTSPRLTYLLGGLTLVAGFVEDFANSSLLPSIFASNQMILPHRKSNPDLFRGSLEKNVFLDEECLVRLTHETVRYRLDKPMLING